MIQLYSEMPLTYLEQRIREIEKFKENMFPEISSSLDDMGCSGSVDFVSSKGTPAGYDTVVIKAKKPGDSTDAIVTLKFPSAHPKGLYTIQWKDSDGIKNIDVATAGSAIDAVDIIETYFNAAFGQLESHSEDYEEDNVKDAKECKAALDKYVLGLEDMKKFNLKTVLTKDISTGAEMPTSRVELGVRKNGKLDPYFTFDFSGGMCHIDFHLVNEDWDENLEDHPSVDSMIEDLVPDIIDEIESQ